MRAQEYRNVAILLAVVSSAIFYYWVSFPVVNTVFDSPLGTGVDGVPVNNRDNFTWWVVLLMLFSGLVPLTMMVVAVYHDSLVYVDIHLLATTLSVILSVFTGLAVLFIALFYCNTVLSAGATACNDAANYCCAYGAALPNQCPPLTIPCFPAVDANTLAVSSEWQQHGWFSLVFFLTGVLMFFPVNAEMRASGFIRVVSKMEARVVAVLFLAFSAGLCWWLVSWILPNLEFIHGYPLFFIPPSPGPFVSYLYSVQWGFIYTLTFNALPVLLLALALLYRDSIAWPSLHARVSGLMAAANFVALAYFIVVIVLITNRRVFDSSGSVSNSDAYCCNFYDDRNCPNVSPCVGPPRALDTNPVFVQMTILTAFYFLNSILHIVLNGRFKAYRILSE